MILDDAWFQKPYPSFWYHYLFPLILILKQFRQKLWLIFQGDSAGNRSADETVFDTTVNLYDRIYLEGLDSIAQAIMAEYKAKSQTYLYDQ